MITRIKSYLKRLHEKSKGSEGLLKKPRKVSVALPISLLFLFYFCYILFIGSILRFEDPRVVVLRNGMGAREIGKTLDQANVVPSGSLLTLLTVALGYENKVVSGPYYFEKEQGIITVLKRIIKGNFELKPARLTFPEGFNVRQITERLKKNLIEFDADGFYELAKGKEGYLFPETYFFLPDVTPEEVMAKFENEFDKNLNQLEERIKNAKKSLEEIIIVASILEREVRSPEDKKKVAGILYKRLSAGMPLQVDATLAYERGLTSFDLTTADLQRDSPYNTYTNKGLPPTPISNPGMDSIIAAIDPEKTPYLYFLTDSAGNVHYAKTFAEHVTNKKKYIR